MRLEALASDIRAFDLNLLTKGDDGAYDLAPQAFRIMQQWEEAATLARLIAVLNRRRPEPLAV